MRHIRVLGAGCAKCKYTVELIREVAAKLGAQAPECAAELQKSITEQIAGAAGG